MVQVIKVTTWWYVIMWYDTCFVFILIWRSVLTTMLRLWRFSCMKLPMVYPWYIHYDLRLIQMSQLTHILWVVNVSIIIVPHYSCIWEVLLGLWHVNQWNLLPSWWWAAFIFQEYLDSWIRLRIYMRWVYNVWIRM